MKNYMNEDGLLDEKQARHDIQETIVGMKTTTENIINNINDVAEGRKHVIGLSGEEEVLENKTI